MTTRDTIYDTAGFVALLLPDEEIIVSQLLDNDGTAGASDYTQSGRRPGVPVYDQAEVAITSTTAGDLSPSMALQTTGAQDTASYHVKVLRGGLPGEGCTLVQRAALDSTAPWKGGQTHNVLTYIHVADQIESSMPAGGAGIDGTRSYACCTSTDGTVIMALGTDGGQIRIVRYDPEARTVAAGAIIAADPTEAPGDIDEDTAFYSTELNGQDDLQVVELLTLPSGRILMFALVIELGWTGATAAKRQLMMSYSDDDGQTWRTGSYLMLDQSPATTGSQRKMRACLGRGGTVLLIIEYTWDSGTTWGIMQFASADDGHTFTLVEDWQTEGGDGRHFDCVYDATTGMITVWYHNETDTQIEYRRIATPFSPLLLSTATVHNNLTPDNITCWADDDGTLYASWNNTEDIEIARSTDGGATWNTFVRDLLDRGLSDEFDWDVTAAKGVSVWMMADPAGDIAGASSRSFFLLLHSGGWDTLTHPQVKGTDPRELESFATGRQWIPWRLPGSYGWTKVGAGTSTLRTSNPFGVTLSTAAQQDYYEDTGTNDDADGVLCWFSVKTVSGGNVAARNVAVDVQIEDGGTDEWQVSIRFDGAQVRMYDEVAAATIATANVDTATSRMEFKLAVRRWPNNSSATTAAATLYSTNTPGSNKWTALISSPAGLTRRVPGGASASHVWWGAIDSSTAESDWHFFLFGRHTGHVGRIVTGTSDYGFFDDLALNPLQAVPYTLFGAPLPTLPARRWVASGLHIHGEGGPATRGDTYKIIPDADYPVRHIHPDVAASPRIPWRSTADNVVQRIGWSPAGGSSYQFGYPSAGLAMFNCNLPYVDWLGYTGGAWSTIGRLDFRGSMTGLAFSLSGAMVLVDTGTSVDGEQWIAHNELVGCTVKLDDGLGNVVYRKIARNTEGAWTDRDTKRPVLVLASLDGTEPTSGTMDLWYREGALLKHNMSSGYTRYAIEIPAVQTADDYYQIGTIVMGTLVVFGNKYSRNRVIQTAPNYEITTALDGTRTGRQLGPARVIVEASWVEGVVTTPLWDSQPAPTYLSARTSGIPFAARGDATILEGVVERLGGGARPCVYLPRVPVTASSGGNQDKTFLAGRERVKLLRLLDVVSRQTTLGSEVKDEVVTITGFRGEGEV